MRGVAASCQVGLCEVMQCYADAGRGRNATGPGRLARCVAHSTPRYPYKCILSIYIISHDFLKISHHFPKISHHFPKISHDLWSKISHEFPKISHDFPKISRHFSKSAFIFRKSAFKYQKSAFIYRKSTLNSHGICDKLNVALLDTSVEPSG